MENMIQQVAEALERKGFARRESGKWVWRNMAVTFRPKDASFLGYWTDGSVQEFSFFDVVEGGAQNHYELVKLLLWVEERQSMSLKEEVAAAA